MKILTQKNDIEHTENISTNKIQNYWKSFSGSDRFYEGINRIGNDKVVMRDGSKETKG